MLVLQYFLGYNYDNNILNIKKELCLETSKNNINTNLYIKRCGYRANRTPSHNTQKHITDRRGEVGISFISNGRIYKQLKYTMIYT